MRNSLPCCCFFSSSIKILSARGVPVFYIDASNPTDGNFLRFIRWTHDKSQQNVVCMQQNQQIHYFSLKVIRLKICLFFCK